ncbi:MAG: hypothetical protein AAF399_20335 [Bacteroidota bacterium]
MISKFNDPQERFDVFEHDIVDADIQDEGYDAEAEVQIAGQGQRLSNREKRKQRRREKKARKAAQEDNYGWAFFLSSMFLGVGVTTLLDHPIGVMMGMAIGFLFFVKPFYQKVMDLIDRI